MFPRYELEGMQPQYTNIHNKIFNRKRHLKGILFTIYTQHAEIQPVMPRREEDACHNQFLWAANTVLEPRYGDIRGTITKIERGILLWDAILGGENN